MTSILLTGGAGFLGTEISIRLLNDPEYDRVVIFSRDWHKHTALREKLGNSPKFRYFIGDILDSDRLKRAFNGIDYIIHAAACKSVPDIQYSPRETALLVNCVGTQNVIDAAIDCEVKKVLFISSDKAAEAGANAYGVSKSMGEHLTIAANSYSPHGTKFSASRYANVWRSSGSVIPLFESQRESGSLTITHSKMTRFWFQPKDAVEFILRCLREMRGGEIFVPELSASLVTDLAKAIAPDAKMEFVGLRPGEKLAEVMITPTESYHTYKLPWNAYRIEPTFKFWNRDLAYPAGSPVPQGWTYSSASATRLTVEQLREML